jgi:hypothetical protein
MNEIPDLNEVRRRLAQEGTSTIRSKPEEVGEDLAHLVWETFSDEVSDPAFLALLTHLEAPLVEGLPEERVTEELLIFVLWVHTRAVQLAFQGRSEATEVRQLLDALHRAVFEDMVQHGTPEGRLPLFEQRVAVRYTEYGAAAEESDLHVGRLAASLLSGRGEDVPDGIGQALANRAIAMAGPLQDFLGQVQL